MSGSLFELLAAVVESWASGPGPAIPKVARILSASSPLPWVASQRGDSGRLKRRTQTISAPAERLPEDERENYRRRPGQRAASDMDKRHVAAAYFLWRELGGVSKGKSNLGTKSQSGDETQASQPIVIR